MRARIHLVCSYCQQVVSPQTMMGRALRTGDRYRAVMHGPPGARCGGSGRPMESASNARLTNAQRAQVEARNRRADTRASRTPTACECVEYDSEGLCVFCGDPRTQRAAQASEE